MSNRRGLGPHASRRGMLRAGLAIGTLALGQRAALGQSGGAHVHMPELGVTKLPAVPAIDDRRGFQRSHRPRGRARHYRVGQR
jgi:hypothetical protein